ncbi:hypothetical protein DESC_180053 [Desulfosarcina cetonica]|nr:hypothetical protein DESC_180053 [Desulfosarcina cetonica]
MPKSECQLKDRIDRRWIEYHQLAFGIGHLAFVTSSSYKTGNDESNAVTLNEFPVMLDR